MEEFSAAFIVPQEFLQLHASERSVQFIKTVIVAVRTNVIGTRMAFVTIPGKRRHAVGPKQSHLRREIHLIRDDHAAFSSDQVLIRKERKGPKISDAACHCSMRWSLKHILVASAYCMACI